MKIVLLGLSITSSWGNGHATTYRSLLRAMAERGHEILFLEQNQPWYADNRDMPRPPFCRVEFYDNVAQLRDRHVGDVRTADCVIVGSYVARGPSVGEWVVSTAAGTTAFYDIDTPVTLTKLAVGDEEYLSAGLIPKFDLYLSFTGGPTLRKLETLYGARNAHALYCSVDPSLYFPDQRSIEWDLGYLGTYSADRQPGVQQGILKPAAATPGLRFAVAGPLYPRDIDWPANVRRIEHLAPDAHQRFTRVKDLP